MAETLFNRFPWQQNQWQQLQSARAQQRLPHALLFAGAKGVGKSNFALAFAQSLLCEAPNEQGEPCGVCRHCHLVQTGCHPDFQRIEPEQESKSGEIKVDTIRALTGSVGLTARSGGHKVIFIRPADRMNSAAANSLLKTLEEPTANTVLLLLTDSPSRLLPTIRSRCQQILFAQPDTKDAIEWLRGRVTHGDPEVLLSLAGGAPLQALLLDNTELLLKRQEMLGDFLALGQAKSDPVKLAERWAKSDIPLLMDWLSGWVIDILRLQTGGEPPSLFNRDNVRPLQGIAERLNSSLLQRFLRQVYEARNLGETNLNPQLVLERLLIQWANCLRQAGH
ncbi:DNA polymerase III subunit delta' [bacterium endosymbiont of Escarpia laminata]|nr:MAG: DNA polymerase III subunit delta' [bacterium endosymbiont of Escarpia laminata]